MNTAQKIVLLSNAGYLGTLDAARSLGKKDVKIIVADPQKWRLSNWSKYVTHVSSPSMEDTEEFLVFLKRAAKKGIFTDILPSSDLMVWYLSSRFKELSKYFGIKLLNPSTMKIVLFKNVLYKFCERHEIDIPKTYFPNSYFDVSRISKEAKYPAIIKHSSSIGFKCKSKGILVFSTKELIKKYKKDEVMYDRNKIINEVPQVEWRIIQEYIPNALCNLYNVKGISMRKSKSISIICGKKIRQEPPKLGISVCAQPVENRKITNAVVKLLRALKYEGIFGVEMIYDERDKKCRIIDFNPRLTGTNALGTVNGFNISELWYEYISKGKVISNKVFNGNVMLIHLISDLLYLPGNLLHAPKKGRFFKELFKSYFGLKKFSVFSLDDPMPFVLDVAGTIYNKVKHPLFYFNEIIKGE